MYLLDLLKKIKGDKKLDCISIFIDMDGVVADYRFGEGKNIKNNVSGTYINKRPIYTTINNLQKFKEEDGFQLYILSSCFFKEQAEEKNKWLDKYMNFIKKENRIFTYNIDFHARIDAKIHVIRNMLELKDCEFAVLIDDTHETLVKGTDELGNRFLPFHVITLID